MPDDRIPKKLFYGELCHGKRTVGGQRKLFKDSLKVSLKDFNISTESWKSLASDRPSWRHLTTKEPTLQRSVGLFQPNRSVQHARPEPPTPTAQPPPTSALPVGEASSPCHGHLRLAVIHVKHMSKDNNNNKKKQIKAR